MSGNQLQDNVEVEEIFTDGHGEMEDQRVQVTTGTVQKENVRFEREVASIDNGTDFIQGILGASTTADVVKAMAELLHVTKPNSSIEEIIRIQASRDLFEIQATESFSTILKNCPREIFWIGVPCLTLLVWKSGETLLYILVCGLICYVVHRLLSSRETAQLHQLRGGHAELQIQSLNRERELGGATAKELANKAVEIEKIRDDAVVKLAVTSGQIVERKLETLKAMQAAQIEGDMNITKMKEDGALGREQLIRETELNVAKVKEASEKLKAEMIRDTEIAVKNLELKQTEIEAEASRKIKKIETEAEIAITKMKSDAAERKIQFESTQAAAERAHQMTLNENRLRAEAEDNRRKVEAERDINIQRIAAEMDAAREQTKRVEIQEQNATQRHNNKGSCSIQ